MLVTDPDGNETQYVYDGGVLVSRCRTTAARAPRRPGLTPRTPRRCSTDAVIDPNGNTSEYSYDGSGNMTSSTNPLSQTASYSLQQL